MASTVLTKRTLEAACRLIENTLISSADPNAGTVAVALFQKPVYFGLRERRFARLARHLSACVVGFDGAAGVVPDGVTPVQLAADDPLAREWTLVVVGPAYGAALVAVDLFDPVTDEPGRRFATSCSFERPAAVRQLRRLQDHLAVPEPASSAVQRAAAVMGGSPAPADLVTSLVVRYGRIVDQEATRPPGDRGRAPQA